MKQVARLMLAVAFTTACISTAQAQEAMTNQSVVQMLQLGLGEQIVISKINASNNDFDVSTSALLALQKDSVPSSVIAAMLTAANDPGKKVVDMNDFHNPHRPGIYYYDEKGSLLELLPSVTNGTKVKNVWGAAFSQGFAPVTQVAQISGGTARQQFTKTPKFYFYFNQQTAAFDHQFVGYGFGTATSPNEFTLARLVVEKNARELRMSSASNTSQESGVDSKLAVHFDITQVAPGIFEVNAGDLAPDQYCFMYGGDAGYSKVYDFGIQ